jgi:WS/DGAT/MGAT family acyltransferase
MAHYSYERLSDQDNEFLLWERPGLPMHVGFLQIFEAKPLKNKHNGVDFEAIRHLVEATLHRVPRHRQKLAWIPVDRHAVWIDDPHFNPEYHIRHTSLPRPGTESQLKELMGRIMAQPLDRAKPLWEFWVVEGLGSARFATILKTHHCMIDGLAGMELVSKIFSSAPRTEIPQVRPFHPRPTPPGIDLWKDEIKLLTLQPLWAARDLRQLLNKTRDISRQLAERARNIGDLVGWKLSPASDSPLNGTVGPNRLFEAVQIPYSEFKEINRALACSVNDVILATVAGALRNYMLEHQVNPDALDFRVEVPVDVRRKGDNSLSNHISSWIVPMPLSEADPIQQVEAIRMATKTLKHSDHSEIIDVLYGFLDSFSLDVQSASKSAINMMVGTIPGPRSPLYLLESRMLEAYPLIPLLDNLGLSIGTYNYDGVIFWGLNADYDRIPDLKRFAELIQESFDKILEAAQQRAAASPPRKSRPKPPRKTTQTNAARA